MRLLATVLGLSMLLLAAGCSSLSEKQCQTANWYELGEHDAYNGYPRAEVDALVKGLAKAHSFFA